jgi:CRP-like cAMP-binding protein
MDELATLFSFNNWPGHLSYILIAVSYWLTDIFWLRVVAVVGLSLEIVYFLMSGGDLRAGIGWDLVFIAINLYQLYRLVQERLSLRLPEKDRDLLRKVLAGLNDGQIARLLGAGVLYDLPAGTTLAEENEALEKLYFICDGRVSVTISGRAVSQLEEGNFVGEVAFLTERPATATAVAETPLRALAFDRDTLKQFFKNETEVAGLIYQLIGRELAHKIKVSNTLIAGEASLGPEPIGGTKLLAAQHRIA